MAVDGTDEHRHHDLSLSLVNIAESGRKGMSPRVSTRFILVVENEKVDVGRDSRPCLAGRSSQARAGTGKINSPCSANQTQD